METEKGKAQIEMLKLALLLGTVLLATAVAQGASKKKAAAAVEYDFQEIVEPRLVSMNTFNEKAAWTAPDSTGFRAIYVNRKGEQIPFECGLIQPASLGDTMPSRINNLGQISGSCVAGNFDVRTLVSFIRERSGALTIVQVPGADGTELFGLNNRGQAVGQFYNPVIPNQSGFFRFHGLVYDKGKLTTLDVPGDRVVTTLWGIDDSGRILGSHFSFDPITNETTAKISFLYDNGEYTILNVPGTQTTDVQDINGLGQIIVNTDQGAFLWDDGQFYPIQPPAGKRILSVDSIDDDGRIVGRYVQSPCPTDFCVPTQFLATPAIQMMTNKTPKK